jgi:hypothetical protein
MSVIGPGEEFDHVHVAVFAGPVQTRIASSEVLK